jgi:hypothetical protein
MCHLLKTLRDAYTYGEGEEPKAQPETDISDEWEDPHVVQRVCYETCMSERCCC